MNITLSLAELSALVAGLAAFFSGPLVVLWRMVVKRNADCEARVTALETRVADIQDKRVADHQAALTQFVGATEEMSDTLRKVSSELLGAIRGR